MKLKGRGLRLCNPFRVIRMGFGVGTGMKDYEGGELQEATGLIRQEGARDGDGTGEG